VKYFGEGLSEKHKELGQIIRKKDKFEDVVVLFLTLHEKLHQSIISNSKPNEVDKLLGDLSPQEYCIMLTAKDETIAWALWHIARIEDLTMNILVGCADQVFDHQWKTKMNAPISDTGNALSDDEIMQLSKELNTTELLAYRNAVGIRTRKIIKALSASDMQRKVSKDDLKKIRLERGVIEEENSIWLLNYWGGKDVAGLLLMPPTRHLILHLNDCCKWKHQIKGQPRFFRTK